MRVISPAAEKLRLRCKCNTCVASSALDEIALHQLLGDSHMPVRHETSATRCARTNASATCPFLLRHRCTISSAILLQVAPLLCPFIKGSAIYNFVYIVTQQSYPVKHIFQIGFKPRRYCRFHHCDRLFPLLDRHQPAEIYKKFPGRSACPVQS